MSFGRVTCVAAGIPFDNSTDGYVANNVQAAIEEAGIHLRALEVSSVTATTSSTTATVLLTSTPVAGTYLATYSGNLTASSAAGIVFTLSIVVGGTQKADSVRQAEPFSSAGLSVFQNMSVATNGLVTVNGSQAIVIQGQTSTGTVTTTQRTLNLLRIT